MTNAMEQVEERDGEDRFGGALLMVRCTYTKTTGRGETQLGRYPELQPPGRGTAKCKGSRAARVLVEHLENQCVWIRVCRGGEVLGSKSSRVLLVIVRSLAFILR